MNCCHIQEALPWYVSGQLPADEIRDMAEHITGCNDCQRALSQMIRLRNAYMSLAQAGTTPSDRVWAAIDSKLGPSHKPHVDVGSFLLGLQVGVSANARRTQVRGDLRIFGHKVRIIGRERKENHVLSKQER